MKNDITGLCQKSPIGVAEFVKSFGFHVGSKVLTTSATCFLTKPGPGSKVLTTSATCFLAKPGTESFSPRLHFCFYLLVAVIWFAGNSSPASAQTKKIVVVVGAEGESQYGDQFKQWSEKWKTAIEGTSEKNSLVMIGVDPVGDKSDSDRLNLELEQAANEKPDELWLILIGHGTFDREEAKFNLRGRDVTAKQLNEWLTPLPCRIVVVNCASASGPFINRLANKNRIVVTATKSGFQHNFSRFGSYLADCIGDPTIDLDKDQQTSLLEAFLAASARTQEFYNQESRLATELALLDDNGDGRGTPADWFVGTRAIQKPKEGAADGLAANQVFLMRREIGPQLSLEQLEKRNDLESQLEQLRERRNEFSEDAYFELLEPILVELAHIYSAK